MKSSLKLGSIIIALLLTVLYGCPRPVPPPSAGDEKLEAAIEAHKKASGQQRIEAMLKLETLARAYPESSLADNALLDVARSLLTEESFDKAIKLLEEILDKYPESDSAPEARFLLGLALFRSGRTAAAAGQFAKIGKKDPRWADASVFYIDALLKEGKITQAIARYKELQKADPKRAADVEDTLTKTLGSLKQDKLLSVLDKLPRSPVSAYVLFLLGERAYNRGDFVTARKYLTIMLTHRQAGDQAEQAREMLNDIETVGKTNRNSIGVMLPLTGKWASYGKRFLAGAALAADVFNPRMTQANPIKLEIADTGGSPEQAADAARRLIIEKRVIAIAGPVQRDTAAAAAKVAQTYGVPIVTMTQMESITDIGSMVFRNSVTPRDQARTIVWYATTALGVKNFAILFPNHSYGQLFKDVFCNEVSRQGGAVVLSLSYERGQADLRGQIREIAKKKREIEAIFIPDSYMAAATIAPQLTYYNVIRVRLLGSSGWDNPRLIELMKGQMSSIEGAIFPDAFFSRASNPITRRFADDFEAAYARKPGMYEAMGYETVRILAERIMGDGVKDRVSMRDALARLENFPTFSGPLSVRPDRSFHRPLFLLQVRNGRIVNISPAGEL